MRVFLFVVGLLAIASGGLKFRGRVMNTFGTSPIALGEVGLGVLSCVIALAVSGPVALHLVLAALTLVSVLAGAYHQSRLTAAFRRRRDLSEAHRLRSFVERPASSEPPDPKTTGDHHGT